MTGWKASYETAFNYVTLLLLKFTLNKISTKKRFKPNNMSEKEYRFHEQAGKELDSGDINKGVWAKAFSESDDINSTKRLYIKYRAEQLCYKSEKTSWSLGKAREEYDSKNYDEDAWTFANEKHSDDQEIKKAYIVKRALYWHQFYDKEIEKNTKNDTGINRFYKTAKKKTFLTSLAKDFGYTLTLLLSIIITILIFIDFSLNRVNYSGPIAPLIWIYTSWCIFKKKYLPLICLELLLILIFSCLLFFILSDKSGNFFAFFPVTDSEAVINCVGGILLSIYLIYFDNKRLDTSSREKVLKHTMRVKSLWQNAQKNIAKILGFGFLILLIFVGIYSASNYEKPDPIFYEILKVTTTGFPYTNLIMEMFMKVDFYRWSFTGGKYIWADGDVYEGGYIDGIKTGKGKYTWPNGNVYEGDWIDDARTGKGKFIWADGDVYEGDFVDGNRTGKGKIIWANGNVYEGDWIDNSRTGKGKVIFGSSTKWPDHIYKGDFVDGSRTGKGKYTWPNGDVYLGYWKNGNMDGKGIKVTNGRIERGLFLNGNLLKSMDLDIKDFE